MHNAVFDLIDWTCENLCESKAPVKNKGQLCVTGACLLTPPALVQAIRR